MIAFFIDSTLKFIYKLMEDTVKSIDLVAYHLNKSYLTCHINKA